MNRTLQCEQALERLLMAVEKLGKLKDGKTLFEGSPIKDKECHAAWMELHNARQEARAVLNCQQSG